MLKKNFVGVGHLCAILNDSPDTDNISSVVFMYSIVRWRGPYDSLSTQAPAYYVNT